MKINSSLRTQSLGALTVLLLTIGQAAAIPQEFFGGGGGGGLIGGGGLLGQLNADMTDQFVAEGAWAGNALPGEWVSVAALRGDDVVRMKRNPKLFGHHPAAVYATSVDKKLKGVSILYIDAGTFFGYEPSGTFEGQSAEAKQKRSELRAKQRDFKKQLKVISEEVRENLEELTDQRGEKSKVGKTKFLQTQFLDFVHGELTLRFAIQENHAVVLTITRTKDAVDHYLDMDVATMEEKARRKALARQVSRSSSGDVVIDEVPVFRQGLRPYCAVSTLGMVTHHLGLRLSVTGLAAGARFKNTGSAKGAKILELYRAAAAESNAEMSRGGRIDFKRLKRAIEKGVPVLVWRKYSPQRDRIHARFASAPQKATLPEADDKDRESWPGKESPGHASVITGFNEERGEIIFMESWGEHTRNKRMRIEEMETTSYMSFYFKV